MRFLICRLSAIGDCIHTMPLVGAIRSLEPAAHITWITQRAPATLLEGYPGLDQILTVPRDYLKSYRALLTVRRQLRAGRFDVALDPQGLTKSSVLAWLSGARRRIGFARPQAREISPWLNNEWVQPRAEHVVDRYLQLLAPLDEHASLPVRFEIPHRHFESLEAWLSGPDLCGGYAVVNPGAGWDSKLWVTERFAAVARYLGRAHQLPTVVVWAGEREQAWAQDIVAASAGHAHLAPSTTLPELAAVLRRARLCLAGDTGPLHLAVAVGTPCVGVYGTTEPRVSGPYGAGHEAVQTYYQAGTCRQRRSAPNTAMRAISVPQVTQACDRLLAQAADRRVA